VINEGVISYGTLCVIFTSQSQTKLGGYIVCAQLGGDIVCAQLWGFVRLILDDIVCAQLWGNIVCAQLWGDIVHNFGSDNNIVCEHNLEDKIRTHK